ncbi:mannitol dehydrogenase family protein [Stappia sp. F7233]|uniref:Mannitol dehydrogenase family protein n=1 Tax=Stappia albiluteola TaxID=2758565 RepID=A0A839AHT8_9HYPH|nr:mannitol dehydrogenase family protein [Stappia albiluteola]MBA5779410.1 mannitol dehydrogenase family protein [Stappia albiluteola]
MSGRERLSSLDGIRAPVRLPAYRPSDHGVGIVHIGCGAFHRAHQAVYTDDALAQHGGDWRIRGISLRGLDVADALNPQHGLYTLLERDGEGTKARIIGSIAGVIAAARGREAALAALAAPAIRIVSLTVTEKAYGIDRSSGAVMPSHPAIAHDLANPRSPEGALGYIVEALRLRREAGLPAFTVLCCDNLPENGKLIRSGTLDYARRIDPDLARWIEANASFPSTMVDRITPAASERTLVDAEALTGFSDHAAIETEPFSQWVIEDDFVAGRPTWEIGGALLVKDVAPYENMKLRMLNGTHSLIAYAGFLSGYRYVRDAMASPGLTRLVRRHFDAAAATLQPLEGINLRSYAEDLGRRFENPAIAHETYQIAMDGTEKLPQRLLVPAVSALLDGQNIASFAFAAASWMRYCLGRDDQGESYALRDPREEDIRTALSAASDDATAISRALHGLDNLFPDELMASTDWRRAVEMRLERMLRFGMLKTIEDEAASLN